jgi:DNA-binding response OmpR family regulator
MHKAHFLWVDDEIDLMKPYILFLEEKGYRTDCATNGNDALRLCREHHYDILFLDEQMPGMSGLELLTRLSASQPDLPMVMVTRSEDEGIMEQAIGNRITDYLIKPVNPKQVLLTVRKILDQKELVSGRATHSYREAFARITHEMDRCVSASDWMALYRQLVYWELELDQAAHPLRELLEVQKREANNAFGRFIRRNYEQWMIAPAERPLISPELFEKVLLPLLSSEGQLFFIVIDNFRLDQWLTVKEIVNSYYTSHDELYCSILPTATPYARNAIFSGLMPRRIAELYPDLWVDEGDERGMNLQEEELIRRQLQRLGIRKSFSYHKISSNREGERLMARLPELQKNELNIVVFNFIDMLSHAGTESKMIRELMTDDSAYRSLTRSWFMHSPLRPILEAIAADGVKVVLTTDHGAIRVKNGVKVAGERDTSVSLRYKLGRNLGYDPAKLFDILHPENCGLPAPHISTRYIFALNNDLLAYPNHYNHWLSHFENSYQHGGVSMEEMLVPLITLTPK